MQIDNETWHETLARLRAERKLYKEANAIERRAKYRDKENAADRLRYALSHPFNLERHLGILNNKLNRQLDTLTRALIRDITERNST